MSNRRDFLRGVAMAGAGAALYGTFGKRRAWAFAQSPTNIRKFATTLPGLGPSGANNIGQYIPVATPTTLNFAGMPTDVYNLGVKQFGENMHPDIPGATHFLGYYDRATGEQKYLGGVIVSKRGRPVLLNVTNQLPNKALIPIDPTVMAGPNGLMVGDLPLNRIAVHLHGGFTPWFSDGTPCQWFDPKGQTGASFMNVPGTNPPGGSANYYYPIEQSARMMWYHDHAMGITRTNAYSGIASALVVIDHFELGLVSSGLLPDLVGIPLVIQDKSFVPKNILAQDPTWSWGLPGDLWYPHIYEHSGETRWDYGPESDPPAQGVITPLPNPSVVPEA